MVRVSKMKYMNIYSNSKNDFIVHNTHKDFAEGHTHINNFDTAKYIAYLALYKRMPKDNHLSIYLIESVIRISDDEVYTNKMKSLKQREIRKKEKKRK